MIYSNMGATNMRIIARFAAYGILIQMMRNCTKEHFLLQKNTILVFVLRKWISRTGDHTQRKYDHEMVVVAVPVLAMLR
jgi:hypothetical protein